MSIAESTVAAIEVEWRPTNGQESSQPLVAYDDWKQGAIIGIRFAMRRIHAAQPHTISVKEIIGQDVDTNPTIVAAAAIDGVWKRFGYQPSQAEWQAIEKIVFESWQKPDFHLPTEFTEG